MNRTAKRMAAGLLALAVGTALPAAAAPNVRADVAVVDEADILSTDTENYVNNLSVALQESCGAQIGVYTVEYIGNTTMEAYCYELGNAWGLGDKDKDNGVVLLLAPGEDDYYVTRGMGLETQLTVSTLRTLLDEEMEPSWLKDDYDTGTRNTVRALTERLCRIYGVSMDIDAVARGEGVSAAKRSSGPSFLTILLIVGAIVLVIWLLGTLSRRRRRGPPPPPPPTTPMGSGGYSAPRRSSSFSDGFASGVGFGIGQQVGRSLFGGPRRPPRPPRPPQPPMGGMGGMGGFGSRPSGGGFRSGGAGRSGGIGRVGGFRSGGGSFRGGGAGRRH